MEKQRYYFARYLVKVKKKGVKYVKTFLEI